MTIELLILFLFSVAGGALAFYGKIKAERSYRLALVFSGAYLFAITIVHILPELFTGSSEPTMVGIFVLLGFFLQQWLETFSQGVEHGHIHEHSGSHGHMTSIVLMIALSAHAFLEGVLLTHPSDLHPIHNTGPLLWGIILHKVPAAFALMTVVRCEEKRPQVAVLFLVIFSLASPLGMISGNFVLNNSLISSGMFSLIFALVAGGFLHISTTIVFESNDNHRLNYQKWLVALIGSGLAVIVEMV